MTLRWVAVIQWPSETGEAPTLIFGETPEWLDRAVIAHLSNTVGSPDDSVGSEYERFVRDNPYPPVTAPDAANLTWLRDLREALVSTCVDIVKVPDEPGLGDEREQERRYW